MNSHLSLSSIIGRGVNGYVYKTKRGTAIKLEAADAELYLCSLSLPGCLASVVDKSFDGKTMLETPLYDGDISSFVHNMNEDMTRDVMRTVIIALNSLNEIEFAHYDVKPANIFYRKDQTGTIEYVLGDFSHAEQFDEGCKYINLAENETAQTGEYRSPEVIVDSKFHIRSDIWSVGILFLVLRTGFELYSETEETTDEVGLSRMAKFYPFLALSVPKEIVELQRDPFPFHIDKLDITDKEKDFVRSLLTYLPEDRPSPKELLLSSYFN